MALSANFWCSVEHSRRARFTEFWEPPASSGAPATCCGCINECFTERSRTQVNETLPDLDMRERIALLPAAAAALVMGVAPLLWLNAIDPAVQAALAPFAQLASKVVGQ